jgi:hypothetical protein
VRARNLLTVAYRLRYLQITRYTTVVQGRQFIKQQIRPARNCPLIEAGKKDFNKGNYFGQKL